MKAQTLINEVTKEMDRKFNPEQQICDLIIKKYPKLKRYIKVKR